MCLFLYILLDKFLLAIIGQKWSGCGTNRILFNIIFKAGKDGCTGKNSDYNLFMELENALTPWLSRYHAVHEIAFIQHKLSRVNLTGLLCVSEQLRGTSAFICQVWNVGLLISFSFSSIPSDSPFPDFNETVKDLWIEMHINWTYYQRYFS